MRKGAQRTLKIAQGSELRRQPSGLSAAVLGKPDCLVGSKMRGHSVFGRKRDTTRPTPFVALPGVDMWIVLATNGFVGRIMEIQKAGLGTSGTFNSVRPGKSGTDERIREQDNHQNTSTFDQTAGRATDPSHLECKHVPTHKTL